MARQYQSETYLYKGDDLKRIWEWNYQLDDRQKEIGDNTFVPNISFLEMNGEIKSYAVWGDGMSILLPKVDRLILARQELKPHRGLEKDEEPEYSVVEWADVEALLLGYSRNDLPIDNFILDYELVPEEIELFFRNQSVTGLDGIKTLPMDMIYDIEFFSSR